MRAADTLQHYFVTHRGMCQYKRLMFGMTSAPGKYQQIVRDVLEGCEGVVNTTADLIIHGNSVEEHHRRLFAVLDSLKWVAVDAYSGKCEFCLSRLTFFGHKLTSYGVNPTKRLQLPKK